MLSDDRARARVGAGMLAASVAAWVALLCDLGGASAAAHCPMPMERAAPFAVSLQMALAMSPPATLAAGWLLMLAAMMPPALIAPVLHLRLRSFAHRRARAVTLFFVAYVAIWMAAGVALVTIGLLAAAFAGPSYWPALAALLVALVWQCSPLKQRSLNRGHVHPALAAFGPGADAGALRFGVTHGVWCVGSCWALMLFALLLPRGHLAAMALVTVLTVFERVEPPAPPAWRVRGIGRTARMAAAWLRATTSRPGSGPATRLGRGARRLRFASAARAASRLAGALSDRR